MNKIFVISGPSGCGKGTIIKKLLEEKDLNLIWAKSYTTRAERASDELEDKYIFVDVQKFKELTNRGEILESNFYNGNWYGTSLSDLNHTLENGKNVMKDVDVNGGKFYKENFPQSVLIFVKCEPAEMRSRLEKGGQNTPKEVSERLFIAAKELRESVNYDYVVENPEGHPEKAVEEIKNIITQACC
jgi:guanylate kinase